MPITPQGIAAKFVMDKVRKKALSKLKKELDENSDKNSSVDASYGNRANDFATGMAQPYIYTGRKVGQGARKIKQSAKDLVDSHKEIGKGEILLFWTVFAICVFDALSNFNRSTGSHISMWLTIYSVIALFTSLYFAVAYPRDNNKGATWVFYFVWHWGVALFATFIPLLFNRLATGVQQWGGTNLFGVDPLYLIVGLIAIFPVYIMGVFAIPWSPARMGKGFLFLLVILLVFALMGKAIAAAGGLEGAGTPVIDVKDAAKQVFVGTGENIKKVVENLVDAPDKIAAGINRLYEPYFHSQVEDSQQDNKLGVYLDDLEPLVEPVFPDDDEIVMYAQIKAKTFTGDVNLKNRCYAEYVDGDRNVHILNGEIVDLPELRIGDYEENTLTCVVNRQLIDTESQFVTVSFNTSFNFVTWGYIDYVFMERNELRNRRNSGEDVPQELGIDRIVKAVYTQGPIKLGMVRSDDPPTLPIALSLENPVLPILGVTLENSRSYRNRGSISKIHKVVFHVPDPIRIDVDTCYPKMVPREEFDEETNYWLYTFSDVPVRRDMTYQTIRCRMSFPDDNTDGFLGSAGIAWATFAVEADYEYEIQETRRVRLQKELPMS